MNKKTEYIGIPDDIMNRACITEGGDTGPVGIGSFSGIADFADEGLLLLKEGVIGGSLLPVLRPVHTARTAVFKRECS